jgi:hypothetical protein
MYCSQKVIYHNHHRYFPLLDSRNNRIIKKVLKREYNENDEIHDLKIPSALKNLMEEKKLKIQETLKEENKIVVHHKNRKQISGKYTKKFFLCSSDSAIFSGLLNYFFKNLFCLKILINLKKF